VQTEPKTPVTPDEIYVQDIETLNSSGFFFTLFPLHYDCKLSFSAYVLVTMIKWLVQHHFILVNGTLIIKIRNRREYYRGTS
jgi:hypothetical protein